MRETGGVQTTGIDPDELALVQRVMARAGELPADHPDVVALRRATAAMFKAVKRTRRAELREAVSTADRAVVAATATGSPERIDDETQGVPLVSATAGASAGTLQRARPCYQCKQRYTRVDAFYHQLCPDCAAQNRSRRDARTDLHGRRALLTGGRAKIGMYIALRLLRDGAHTTITTRFPHDAVRRFTAMDDSADWIDRLTVVGIDLRDPTQVTALADDVAAAGPLDVLINNACQTVRRSPGAYAPLLAGESAPLPTGIPLPELVTFDRVSEAHPASIAGALAAAPVAAHDGESPEHARAAHTAAAMTALALKVGGASITAHRDGTAVDAGGLLPDTARVNSWTQTLDEVDPLELLEVQLCNSVAPFLLVSRLRPALAAGARRASSGRAHVVNVSAMEGQFARQYKGAGHPHTNMAKAALNMMTRTSAGEMWETDRIQMNAVDTGWITDERPHETKLRLADEGFHAPLDLVDGAARVYDPVVQGEAGVDLVGHFLKDFTPSPW